MSETGWRPWLPETVAALAVLTMGLSEGVVTWAWRGGHVEGIGLALGLPVVVALAVWLCRREPGVALALTWALGLFHVAVGAPVTLTEFALTAVFFGGARWGRPPTVVVSALSIPLAVAVAFVLHDGGVVSLDLLLGGPRRGLIPREPTVRLSLALIGLLVVAAPWPAGLAMRFLDRAGTSRASMLAAEEAAAGARRDTEHAREIAQLRDEQTRLARDVHDVVGHSLAVILAQAESGQYLDETAKLKNTLRTIATSARSSLRDVRQVLSTTRDTTSTQDPTAAHDDVNRLDALFAGVRGSGHEIVVTEQGTPRPLSREAAAVAYRVLQEMLTNAIKHGRRDQPITAERRWVSGQPTGGIADTLRIEVANTTESSGPDGTRTGHGLDGMRRRLETIGGHLDVRPAGTTFTVVASVPVQGGA
jgi:signal transduction histidine kinase